ncbi:class I SAM-dependent methyltransferase [Laribacter hongkongensis]|uniref:class I SAM-dependent methyltransferase n=1 Tax=Laribacter hongkongensis TaxID=168471 RepID=UPI001EFE121B|nr:class I SAM-dependent methyltransferase [Laribacter hongkongensis]MCG9032995.1 class I SAM-dependent methyltransferase [Laribacter hongkongensis]MCG9093081.1 class I SAM-dependent methyltransferase [Laribacter hongkongensis]
MVKRMTDMDARIDYQAQYDGYWKSTDRIGESSGDMNRIAEQIVMTCGIGRTLDVGSGEGSLVASLLSRGVDAHGVDVSEVVTARCNRRMPDRFTHGSVLELPFQDASFQTVVSTDCMEHLAPEDVPKALKEIHRVASRFVFLQLATTLDRDGHWHLTVEGRAWWEAKCFEAGFRKHPAYYKVNSYESLNADGWQITIVLEKIPKHAHKKYPLSALAAERDLHMDMLREVGERSDAHVARYLWAEKYVRQGDRVLDAACGLGYGSYALAELSKASNITGVDGSDCGVDYARDNFCPLSPKLDFFAGYLPGCLAKYPDGHFDVIVSFETLEHVEHPEALLTEFHRILSPGGRIVVSVPNDWSDETGEDPNPFHLHVYTLDKLRAQIKKHFIPEALFQQIASGCKTTSAWNSWQRMPRTLRSIPINSNSPPPSEWWLMVGMKDPVSNSVPYRESVYGYSAPPANLLQFERDYQNPWLVRCLLEFQFRATNNDVLRQVAQRVLAQESDQISADKGAALAVLGYQLLTSDHTASADVEQFIEDIEPYVSAPLQIPHLQRFHVSLAYLKARLLFKIGRFDAALPVLKQVANADLSIFSPTLGTKVIDAAFEAGLLDAGRGDIVAARVSWKIGVERAYALLSSEVGEFVGDINNPHEFPTIVAVEFLDSAVRCIKALRVTAKNSFVPLTRLYELTRENWKGMLEERWAAIQSMEAMIRERDEAISGQARMLEERWAVMQSMEAMIRERDDKIIEQRRLLEKRLTVTEAMRVLFSAVWASFQHRVGRVLGKHQ